MIHSGKIVSENTSRHQSLNKPYNPVTGEGCCGERVRIEIEDALVPVLYLPQAMQEMKICRDLQQYGSLKKLFRAKGVKPDGELVIDFWMEFCEQRYKYDFEYFAVSCITIRDKISSEDIPFRLNRGQRKLLATMEQMRTDNLIAVRLMSIRFS
ncbi:MAG: hypothetical protein LBF05_08145 [Tannerella sp.]|jgi:hypothetical protein|nr:hypothetical protein [Tannerella sp.]